MKQCFHDRSRSVANNFNAMDDNSTNLLTRNCIILLDHTQVSKSITNPSLPSPVTCYFQSTQTYLSGRCSFSSFSRHLTKITKQCSSFLSLVNPEPPSIAHCATLMTIIKTFAFDHTQFSKTQLQISCYPFPPYNPFRNYPNLTQSPGLSRFGSIP